MALQKKSIIYCEHTDGRKTHFDRKTFLKLKMDKAGTRNGWKPISGEVTSADNADMSTDSNVPNILKTVKPQGKGVSEEEVQRRIDAAVEREKAKQRREASQGKPDESLKINDDNTEGGNTDPNANTTPVVTPDADEQSKDNEKTKEKLEDVRDRTAKGKPDESQKKGFFQGKK